MNSSLAFTPRQSAWPQAEEQQIAEWKLCKQNPIYFIGAYCWVFNATENDWIPFDLWPAQAWALHRIVNNLTVIILKARQLGFTWLMLGFALWLMLFHSAATIGIFSNKEGDSQELLDFRLKGMYERLPPFMRCESVTSDNKTRWQLSNGSTALAFPTTGGRGYTFSFALVDEGDFQPDLPDLMRAIKPTVDAGGRMAIISTSDKGKPESLFKKIYLAAVQGMNSWTPLFLPWNARPERTEEWYEAVKADTESTTGSLDDLHQEYPLTDTEALSPRTLDKRIPYLWIEACYAAVAAMALPEDGPSIEGLEVIVKPESGARYVIGGDPAEGNPTSDDSALTVMRRDTGEEVAVLSGKYEPRVFGLYIRAVGIYYNNADVMVERNNHGHAVLMWLLDYAPMLRILSGHDDKVGWLSSRLGKTLLYENLADTFRAGNTVLHTLATYTQIASIEGNTLRAPTGQHDDRADSYALADVGRVYSVMADEEQDTYVQESDVNISVV